MKYIKLYENIDWDWVEEENDPISDKFNKVEEKILKREFIIIKIHIKYDNDLVKLLNKYSIRNLGKGYYNPLTGMVYFYIDIRDIAYMPDDKFTEDYNNRNYSHIEIIEIV
jgi:hypothetical protein